jgi:dUTP pyrophosphatase
VILIYKLMHEAAKPPSRAHDTDAGWDLTVVDRMHIMPGSTVKVSTGLALALPPKHYGDIRARSSVTLRGVQIAGVVDTDYRGIVYLLMTNVSPYGFDVKPGERYAQMLVLPVPECQLVEEVEELPVTVRGTGGFGSSDRKPGNGG